MSEHSEYEENDCAYNAVSFEPSKRISFNAPFTIRQKCCIRLTNNAQHTIQWSVRTTAQRRLYIGKKCGLLLPFHSLAISIHLIPCICSPGKFDRLTFTTAIVDEQQNLAVPTSQRRQTILIHYNF
ncbi:Major sperm protein isoform alpha [Trichinella zimbabwensis]|uniref:Major sperm protein n=2 Tax=Trichinella TaxID=6333 RepID=A0A0V1MGS5_9BILA|nr:Major sperm protein isoform alpha [Trichinella zimbabwensis]KRZ71112.1 Major sperm protein isoform alpha [Trichinella papuae]